MKKRLSRFISINLTKRTEFVVITVLLTAMFVIVNRATELMPPGYHFWGIALLSVSAVILSAVGLRETTGGIRWFTLLLLPAFFTAGIGLFYFLLPMRWLTRIPMALVYALGIYSILLVENIFGVASTRSIQLLRVAQAVGFVATLATLFFFFNIFYSFRLPFYYISGLVYGITCILMVQSFWAITLQERIDGTLIRFSSVLSFLVAQVSIVLSFWPLKPVMASLFLTTICYTLIGIGHHYMAKRLFQKNILEYVQVFVIVLFLIFLTTTYR